MTSKMKVLIGYDGSAFADSAIEDLTGAGLNSEIDALVLSVRDVAEPGFVIDKFSSPTGITIQPDAELIRKQLAELTREPQRLAESAAARVKELFGGWNVKGEACIGKPAWEIIEKADVWPADLIVVGSQGWGALGRLILGSVSQKVLNEARCSVRISRKRANHQDPLRILIAFDGSDFAIDAVQTVADRKWPQGTEFRIIIADDDVSARPEVGLIDYMPEGKKDSPTALDWIHRMVDTPCQILEAAGLEVSYAIRWGGARSIILNEAEDWKADSIFMGSRGRGRFRRFLLGSVAAGVAAKAKCSVEVVRGNRI